MNGIVRVGRFVEGKGCINSAESVQKMRNVRMGVDVIQEDVWSMRKWRKKRENMKKI